MLFPNSPVDPDILSLLLLSPGKPLHSLMWERGPLRGLSLHELTSYRSITSAQTQQWELDASLQHSKGVLKSLSFLWERSEVRNEG